MIVNPLKKDMIMDRASAGIQRQALWCGWPTMRRRSREARPDPSLDSSSFLKLRWVITAVTLHRRRRAVVSSALPRRSATTAAKPVLTGLRLLTTKSQHPNPRRSTLVSAPHSLSAPSLSAAARIPPPLLDLDVAHLDPSSTVPRFLPRRDYGERDDLISCVFVLAQSGMASSSARPCDRRVAPAVAASAAGVLPLDALYEILLRVPAKALCRMRAVSRPWRRLLSDAQFAAAHAARYQEPLFICVDDDIVRGDDVDVVDLYGRVVKRVHGDRDDRVSCMPHDLVVFFNRETLLVQVVDPATGAVHLLPGELCEEHAARGFRRSDFLDEDQFLLGLVPSTSEYKVLRILSPLRRGVPELCEVCTLGSNGYGNTRWRGKQPPPNSFELEYWNNLVVGGVAFLIMVSASEDLIFHNRIVEQNWIMLFDMEKEEWGPNIRGPQLTFDGNRGEIFNPLLSSNGTQLTLSNLNGSLAVVHGHGQPFYMDIWILKDIQKGLWVKQYSLQVEQGPFIDDMHPLFVLDDGRIVIYKKYTGLLQSYDPRTNAYTNFIERTHYSDINIYTGNLLRLKSGQHQ